jgi:uncharacterized membrane protein
MIAYKQCLFIFGVGCLVFATTSSINWSLGVVGIISMLLSVATEIEKKETKVTANRFIFSRN